MVDPHDLAEDKQALCEFASTRYAVPNKIIVADSAGTTEVPPGPAPFLASKHLWTEMTKEGNYLVVDGGLNRVFVINYPDYDTLWEYSAGLATPQNAQDLGDTVIISDTGNNRIIEVRKEDNSVVNELTGTGLGAFGAVRGRKNLVDGDLWVVDEDNHVAVETNWAGDVLQSFGTYGTAGSDASHLDSPQSVAPSTADRAYVADTGNDRVLIIRNGVVYSYKTPASNVHTMQDEAHGALLGRTDIAVSGWANSTFLLEETGTPWWFPPLGARYMTMTRNGTVLFRRHHRCFEIPIKSTLGRPERSPFTTRQLNAVTLGAGTSTDIQLWNGFLWNDTIVRVLSTESATLNVYMLNYEKGIRAADIPATWNEIDEISLTADSYETYIPSILTGMLGFEVEMGGASGDVSMWLEGR